LLNETTEFHRELGFVLQVRGALPGARHRHAGRRGIRPTPIFPHLPHCIDGSTFEYRLEHHPEFLRRIEEARVALRAA
jgi:hypothetical protein